VRTRTPITALLVVAAAAGAYPVYALAQYPLRKDFGGLPWWWFVPVALLWLAGFALPLTLALLPASGQVLPNHGRAGRAALAFAALLTLVGVLTFDVPGKTVVPDQTWAEFSRFWWHCISFSARIIGPVLIAGTLALAGVMLTGAARLGAAVGAAGGALAGLTLHALCPIGGVAHVALAHGGAVVVGAMVGALVFSVVRRLVDRIQPASGA
jgi:hypothetical protein